MQFFQITSVVSLVGAFVSAAPTPDDTNDTVKALGQATVRVYRSDTCSDQVDSVSLFDGGYSCLLYTNVRSILADSSGCKVRAWSGNDCRGNSYSIDGGCNSVLFASVSIQC